MKLLLYIIINFQLFTISAMEKYKPNTPELTPRNITKAASK